MRFSKKCFVYLVKKSNFFPSLSPSGRLLILLIIDSAAPCPLLPFVRFAKAPSFNS